MTATLLMAITVNGFIAGPHDDTEWVKDFDALYGAAAEYGVVVMGKRTYDECVKFNAFPYKGALNIVMTHDVELLAKLDETVIFTNKTPVEILALAAEKGFERVLIIGGGHINGSFLVDKLIDEIVLDVHPMLMSEGIKLFEADFDYRQLELLEHKEINDQILQVRYKVKK